MIAVQAPTTALPEALADAMIIKTSQLPEASCQVGSFVLKSDDKEETASGICAAIGTD